MFTKRAVITSKGVVLKSLEIYRAQYGRTLTDVLKTINSFLDFFIFLLECTFPLRFIDMGMH